MIHYTQPKTWLHYDFVKIAQNLIEAKSAILSLKSMPYQKDWVERLQLMELKREVAGTSRIEGADFTDSELVAAMNETPDEFFTRSQRQAHSATNTYRWLATIPEDKLIDAELIREIHRRMITGADDDHCQPGVLRKSDENVNFGQPRHRGVSGGDECQRAFDGLANTIGTEFKAHDPIIQAVAAHYHLAAMHPFLDGNGRTARALEALFLQRAGLRDISFVSVSNYYYDEKRGYLKALSESGTAEHDLTAILNFCLRGIAKSVGRVLQLVKTEVAKDVYRNTMYDLFNSLKSTRRRVVSNRQVSLLKFLLEKGSADLSNLFSGVKDQYQNLKDPGKAYVRDLKDLLGLGAIRMKSPENIPTLSPNLNWPQEISETEFFEKLKNLPKAKSYPFL